MFSYYSLFTGQYKYMPSGDLYNYIVSSFHVIKLFEPYLVKNMTILDVGSGLGEFMLFLKHYSRVESKIDIQVFGIEIDHNIKNYVKIPTTFIDAFEFTDYAKYDLIYLYQPIKNVEKMENLLKYILLYNKKIIYNNSDLSEEALINLNFQKIKHNVWHSN